MGECRDAKLLNKMLSLAKLKVTDEEFQILCRDVERIASYLRQVSELASKARVEPLYHVWEEVGFLREGSVDRRVDIRDFAGEVVKDGWIRVPWRGERL